MEKNINMYDTNMFLSDLLALKTNEKNESVYLFQSAKSLIW